MISKELFSEVMNTKKEDIIDLKMFGKDLKYYEKCLLKSCCDDRLSKHKDSIRKSINIYELAFKCKNWAYSKCNEIISYTEGCEIYQTQLGETIKDFYAETEHEAIFKACQWILDNKEG